MSIWSTYEHRMNAHGTSKHNAALLRETRTIETRLKDSLSYQTVEIYPCKYGYNINSPEIIEHRILQDVSITKATNLNEKTICSIPGEDIHLGSLVHWMDNYWLVTERSADTTLYTKAKLTQCNHLLKWITPEHQIMEQWCIIEDGTKYLVGEYEDRNFVVTRGDTRISLQIAKNKYTDTFNRESRFLIDDEDSPHKLSYLLTKPFKMGWTYNGEGTYKFVLQEVTATNYDNHELGLADYYSHFPKEQLPNESEGESENNEKDGNEVWI